MNNALQSTGTVAVVLSAVERPCVYPIPDVSESELVLEGEVFKDSGAGDWLGFYDWLRTKTGNIIGVRLWADEASHHLRAAGGCVNVITNTECFPFVVFLGDEREFVDENSCDQDFGSNMLLLSSGKFALTFSSPR
ncbi:hypothetical protein M8A51_26190 [Schlegelella sp. S2-27]|uniref:Uncharacterized protein n=1 Tax=Caldimonas mangrovi TaxID=2944811 RepID=A0ABT0YW79_9BURK|nr:hypothetical protein [Caldimonas mangrovi]MCM5683007.1 hypothetical protein [Caldimonas mangrovi]